ncbi:MAG: hypothetical protein ACLFNI_05300 [Natronomonas sp.]
MFERRSLPADLATLRTRYAPEAFVFDMTRDFEILPPDIAENLAPLVAGFDPHSYPDEWVPADAPAALHRLASSEFTIGAPGDGGIAWTRQTEPPTVFVKPRMTGSPDDFVDFLVAEALVEIGLGTPEHFLGFFEDGYLEFADVVPLDPVGTYQLAAAVFDAYVGLYSREEFDAWDETHERLFDAWLDAGERLTPRLEEVPSAITSGRTAFAAAAEFACSAVKHRTAETEDTIQIPPPFAALDSGAYQAHGPAFAIRWAEKTFAPIEGDADDEN